MGHFSEDARIRWWGLRNEVDILIWKCGHSYSEVKQWIDNMVPKIREVDTLHPIEIELTTADVPTYFGLVEDADIVGLSNYRELPYLESAIEYIQNQSDLPIIISEFGCYTIDIETTLKQHNIIESTCRLAEQYSVGTRPWCLMDYDKQLYPPEEEHFGLVDVNGVRKDAFYAYKYFRYSPPAILYSDDFDDGNADGWEEVAGNWTVSEGSNYVNYIYTQLQTYGRAEAFAQEAANNLDISCRVKLASGDRAGIIFRGIDSDLSLIHI